MSLTKWNYNFIWQYTWEVQNYNYNDTKAWRSQVPFDPFTLKIFLVILLTVSYNSYDTGTDNLVLDQLASGYTTLLKFETNREDLYYDIQ